MRFPPSLNLAAATALTATALLLLPGCGPAGGQGGSPGAGTRRQSEFDYYCTLRPASAGGGGLSKDGGGPPQRFAPAVYAAMRSRGYKVYLLSYKWERRADPFYPVSTGLPGGYGLRDFFGTPTATTVMTQTSARSAATNASGTGTAGRSGYGLRNFFGLDDQTANGPHAFSGRRSAVVWETARGEFFLVDHYYATPVWLDGTSWVEKVRFYDSTAVSVEVVKS